MFKFFIGSILVASSLFSKELPFNEKDYSNMVDKGELLVKDKFNDLSKQIDISRETFNTETINDFLNLADLKKSFKDQLNMVDSLFTGSEFINKAESVVVIEDLKKGLEYSQKPKQFILYFFSESVPKRSVLNFLLDIDILKTNGFDINSKQYMVGYPEDYKAYMYSWKDKVEEYPAKYRISATNSFAMKLDPRFFDVYDIKSVPAMAFATCAADIPSIEGCKIDYLIHGDTPLITFLDKMSLSEKNENKKHAFTEMTRVLNANQIYKPKDLLNEKEVTENENK